jgi:hypothetical protein
LGYLEKNETEMAEEDSGNCDMIKVSFHPPLHNSSLKASRESFSNCISIVSII